MITSNWCSAELGELDFSAARMIKGDNPAKPIFTTGILHEGSRVPTRRGFGICGESDEGVWVTGIMGEPVWERVRRSGLFTVV